jgi:hypothetical protein
MIYMMLFTLTISYGIWLNGCSLYNVSKVVKAKGESMVLALAMVSILFLVLPFDIVPLGTDGGLILIAIFPCFRFCHLWHYLEV